MSHHARTAYGKGRTVLAVLPILLALTAVVPSAKGGDWIASPYRAKCVVLLDEQPELQNVWRDALPAALPMWIRARLGPMIHLETSVQPTASWRIGDLANVRTEAVLHWEPAATSFDKVFVVVVESSGLVVDVGCIEWDMHTRSFSDAIVERHPLAPSLDRAIAHSLLRAFRPIGRIIRFEQRKATLEMRAGQFASSGVSGAQPGPGQVMQPFHCRLNARGEITEDGIAAVRWTMLRVDPSSTDHVRADGTILCSIDSGFRSPFRVRSSRRVERYALGVRSGLDQTIFQLESNTDPAKPLLGYELHGRRPDESRYELVGTSDRQGRIIVARQDPAYRIFCVKHGNMLLAKLPCLVGLEVEIKLELPDDAERLKAEAFTRGIEDDLLDTIVKRELAMASFRRRLARHRLTARDLEAARRDLRQIEALNQPDDLFRAIQRRETAYRSDDPFVQKRIDLLFRDLRQSIRSSMDPKVIAKLESELAERER